MAPTVCGVQGCRSYQHSCLGYSGFPMFSMPKDKKGAKLWIKKLPNKVDIKKTSWMRICILHFPTDVVKKARFERKRPSEPPSIFYEDFDCLDKTFVQDFLKAAGIFEERAKEKDKDKQVQKKKKKINKCLTCGLIFSVPFSLRRHQKTHIGSKPDSYDTTGKAINQKTHSGSKPCKTTGTAIHQSYVLRRHNLSPHSSSCEKTPCLSYALRRHMKTHTETKPSSISSTSEKTLCLSTARQTEEEETTETSSSHKCKCNLCNKTFRDSYGLRRHDLRWHSRSCDKIEPSRKLHIGSAEQFIYNLSVFLQSSCKEYFVFETRMELVGSMNVTIDNKITADFILSETFQKKKDNSITLLSNSYFTKSGINRDKHIEALKAHHDRLMDTTPDARFGTQFLSNLSMSLYSLCNGYFNFHSGIQVFGHINITMDQPRSVDYVLSETLCKKADATISFKSNSCLVKEEMQQVPQNKTGYNSEDVQLLYDSKIERPDSLNIEEVVNIKESVIDIKYDVVPILNSDIEHSLDEDNSNVVKVVEFNLEPKSEKNETLSDINPLCEEKLETSSDINPLCEVKLETSSDINTLCEDKLESSSDINPLCEFKLETSDINPLCEVKLATDEQHLDIDSVHDTINNVRNNRNNSRKYKCTLCSESFEEKDQLFEHKVVHLKTFKLTNNNKTFKCQDCEECFTRSHLLEAHVKGHKEHKASSSSAFDFHQHRTSQSIDKTQSPTNSCNVCNRSFETLPKLLTHRKIYHRTPLYKCFICEITFPNQKRYYDHRKKYHANHMANHMETTKKSEQDISLDHWTKGRTDPLYNPPSVFRCPFCKSHYASNAYLQQHIRIHTGEKPFKCKVCCLSFICKRYLKNHKCIDKKDPLNVFRCPYCKCKYNSNSYLQQHIRLHTGEKPFKCNVCCLSFICKRYLKRHKCIDKKQ